jgi:hypothetical protein
MQSNHTYGLVLPVSGKTLNVKLQTLVFVGVVAQVFVCERRGKPLDLHLQHWITLKIKFAPAVA